MSECRGNVRRGVHRLSRALGFQRKLLDQEPIHEDLIAESEAVAAWPFVACAYRHIEQSFKSLLGLRRISFPRGGAQGHLIYHKHFKVMPENDRAVIRRSHRAYRSLHDYIPHLSADGFLQSIGKGL